MSGHQRLLNALLTSINIPRQYLLRLSSRWSRNLQMTSSVDLPFLKSYCSLDKLRSIVSRKRFRIIPSRIFPKTGSR